MKTSSSVLRLVLAIGVVALESLFTARFLVLRNAHLSVPETCEPSPWWSSRCDSADAASELDVIATPRCSSDLPGLVAELSRGDLDVGTWSSHAEQAAHVRAAHALAQQMAVAAARAAARAAAWAAQNAHEERVCLLAHSCGMHPASLSNWWLRQGAEADAKHDMQMQQVLCFQTAEASTSCEWSLQMQHPDSRAALGGQQGAPAFRQQQATPVGWADKCRKLVEQVMSSLAGQQAAVAGAGAALVAVASIMAALRGRNATPTQQDVEPEEEATPATPANALFSSGVSNMDDAECTMLDVDEQRGNGSPAHSGPAASGSGLVGAVLGAAAAAVAAVSSDISSALTGSQNTGARGRATGCRSTRRTRVSATIPEGEEVGDGADEGDSALASPMRAPRSTGRRATASLLAMAAASPLPPLSAGRSMGRRASRLTAAQQEGDEGAGSGAEGDEAPQSLGRQRSARRATRAG